MLTKGAIGNLVNRYRAVLKKCNLINTFGSLAVASMIVLGGAGVAEAAVQVELPSENIPQHIEKNDSNGQQIGVLSNGKSATISGLTSIDISSRNPIGIRVQNNAKVTLENQLSDLVIDVEGVRTYFTSGNPRNSDSTGIEVTNNSQFTINAKNLTVKSYTSADGNAYGIKLNGLFGKDNKSFVTITANNTYIWVRANNADNATALCVTGQSGLAINGNVTIDASGGYVLSTNHKSNTVINEAGSSVVKLDGNIKFYWTEDFRSHNDMVVDSNVQITLATSDSYWKGSPVVAWSCPSGNTLITNDFNVDNMVLNVKNGATWEPVFVKPDMSIDATSMQSDYRLTALNHLNLDGGNVNIMGGVNALVDNVITGDKGGNINIADVENAGTFTVAKDATKAALTVQALDADTKTVKNADQVTTARLAELQKQVKYTDGKAIATTAYAPEGYVMGATTVDANGVSMAKNTVMEAALEQASVTTIAVDKLLTNDVRKRLGDIRNDKNTTGVWMRWDGGKLQGDGLSNDFNTIQIGGDTKVAKNCRLGVAGSFSHGDAEFARGTAELEGFSLASYATWMGENGMFADVVARLGQFNNEMSVEGRKGKLDNRVFSLSGEYGWRLPVCEQFFVEPQVELAYTYVSSDTLELGEAKYLIDSVDSLTGRAGVVVGWNLPDDRGNVYARASVLQQFMGDAKITGSINGLSNVQKIDGDDTWLEYGIGANVKLTDKTYIWADVERTEGATIEEEWRGTVGIRYSF